MKDLVYSFNISYKTSLTKLCPVVTVVYGVSKKDLQTKGRLQTLSPLNPKS